MHSQKHYFCWKKTIFSLSKTTNLVSNIWYSNSFSSKWREVLLCFQFEGACNEIETNSSSTIVGNEKWKKSYWRMKRARKENLLLFHEIFLTEENCHIMQHEFRATKDHTKLWILRWYGIRLKEELIAFSLPHTAMRHDE